MRLMLVISLAMMELLGCGKKQEKEESTRPPSAEQRAKFQVLTVNFSSSHEVLSLVPAPSNRMSKGVSLNCELTFPSSIATSGSSDRQGGIVDASVVANNSAVLNISLTEPEIQEGSYNLFCYVYDPLDALKITLVAKSVAAIKDHTPYYWSGATAIQKGDVKTITLNDEVFFHRANTQSNSGAVVN